PPSRARVAGVWARQQGRRPGPGVASHRHALAFDLWRMQIALGRLVPVLYALVKRGAASGERDSPSGAAHPSDTR
ncbi:MAG TPA: hypothetical protein VFA45_06050, partial [Actinomycetes bacterium]|nr:hypothetical protein [Actinomycetes bacterium]